MDSNSVFYKNNLNDDIDPYKVQVLLVDDNCFEQKSLKERLKNNFITAAVVHNGEQAVAAIRERIQNN
jgi:PleD family two-component response regulator